uniref:Uncharacterized protein n=1 Tax=Micrurus paraensis TaxID=1970185 RepID=A0A2D4JVU2_9SAUR
MKYLGNIKEAEYYTSLKGEEEKYVLKGRKELQSSCHRKTTSSRSLKRLVFWNGDFVSIQKNWANLFISNRLQISNTVRQAEEISSDKYLGFAFPLLPEEPAMTPI